MIYFLIQKLIKIKYTTPVFSFILLSLIFYPFSTYKLDDLHSEFRKCKDDVKTRTRQTTATMIIHLVKMTLYANSSMKSRGELNTFYNKINYNLKMFVVRSTRRLFGTFCCRPTMLLVQLAYYSVFKTRYEVHVYIYNLTIPQQT